jgi:hypothetical protein
MQRGEIPSSGSPSHFSLEQERRRGWIEHGGGQLLPERVAPWSGQRDRTPGGATSPSKRCPLGCMPADAPVSRRDRTPLKSRCVTRGIKGGFRVVASIYRAELFSGEQGPHVSLLASVVALVSRDADPLRKTTRSSAHRAPPWFKRKCGATDRTETGLQVRRRSRPPAGATAQAYNCNPQKVGPVPGRRSEPATPAWSTTAPTTTRRIDNTSVNASKPGTVVVDAPIPMNFKGVAYPRRTRCSTPWSR